MNNISYIDLVKLLLNRYKLNNLFLDNEILFNYYDEYLCNPFVDSLQADRVDYYVSSRFYFNSNAWYSKIYLWLEQIIHGIIEAIGRFISGNIIQFKYWYLGTANDVLKSQWYLNKYQYIHLDHLELVIQIWIVIAFTSMVILWVFFIIFAWYYIKFFFIVYYFFKKDLDNTFFLYLDIIEYLVDFIEFVLIIIMLLILSIVFLPFQKQKKCRKIWFLLIIGFIIYWFVRILIFCILYYFNII